MEGGQSATGAALDDLISRSTKSVTFEYLNSFLAQLGGENGTSGLTKNIHVLPFFKGNRSPHADPTLEAVLVGDRIDRGMRIHKYYAQIGIIGYLKLYI